MTAAPVCRSKARRVTIVCPGGHCRMSPSHACFCHHPDRGIGEPFAEVEVEPAVFFGRRAAESESEPRALGRGVRSRSVGKEFDIDAPIARIPEARDRGADSIERRPGHQADTTRIHLATLWWGSFVTRLDTPPFCAGDAPFPRSTPFFCMTTRSGRSCRHVELFALPRATRRTPPSRSAGSGRRACCWWREGPPSDCHKSSQAGSSRR